tara:strand:+ start:178 stop:855 length:678 start_codon:yes stop_codon:yes gene_type:complete
MRNRNEKGFALVLSLVLLLAMSLMGGALIVISAGDHKSNNTSDDYQQTFYVAETALLEGEKYLLNQFLGPWDTNTHTRDQSKRNLPANKPLLFKGDMTKKNYDDTWSNYYNTSNFCYNSFKDIDRSSFKVVAAESWNFGKFLFDSFNAAKENQEEATKLFPYYYEFFLTRIGAAPFRGYGSSIKKGATDSGNDGMAYRVYGCGIKSDRFQNRIIVSLESVVVLPK